MAHIHEVVYNLVHWFDDKIFELYPMWEACIAGQVFSPDQLTQFFGPPVESNDGCLGGLGAYAKSVKTGIGRYVIAKMLEGTASANDIRKAMDNFPMTEQRRRRLAQHFRAGTGTRPP